MEHGFLQRILRYFSGYLLILVSGSNAERFFNMCCFHDIHLYELKRQGSSYHAEIKAADYFRLRPVIKKTGICPVILSKKGFPFFLRRNRKRKILFFCAFCFAAGIYYLSGFLWRIEYQGCYYHTKEELQSFLRDNGLYEGVRRSKADCTEVEEAIRSRYPDIGWVSAEIRGTVMKISIQETKMPSLSAETASDGYGEVWTEETGHIKAARDGIVSELTVISGTAMVKTGDVVRKGDILISGIITIIGDDGTAVNRYPVLAKGNISLKTTERYEDIFSLEYEKRVYTGREKKGFSLRLFGTKIFSYMPSNSYKDCDIINEMGQYCIGKDFYLPIWMSSVKIREYHWEPAVYLPEEARLLAEDRTRQYLTERKAQGAVILEAELTTELLADSCSTTGTLVLLEPAWQYQTIIPDEWRLEGGE